MSRRIMAYFIGGPFDLTKRIMNDPGPWYAMAVIPPTRVPPFGPEQMVTMLDTVTYTEAKYRKLGSLIHDRDTYLFEYEPVAGK